MKSEPDYYTILQVNPRAEPEVIQAAYRRLAAKHHPDVDPSPEAMERMKLLNAAYEVLSDTVKRREHDMSRLRGQQQTIGDTSTMQCPWWFLVLAGGCTVTSAALQRQTSSDSSPCVPATLALDELAASAKVDTKPHLSLTSVH